MLPVPRHSDARRDDSRRATSGTICGPEYTTTAAGGMPALTPDLAIARTAAEAAHARDTRRRVAAYARALGCPCGGWRA